MNTEAGVRPGIRHRCGIREGLPSVGRLIAMVTGSMCPLGDGPGLTTPPGALRHSTTVAGSTIATVGVGRLDQSMLDLSMRQRL